MKYILSLFILLWSMMTWGQGEGFDPSNPQEPGQKYFLTVTVSPEGAGSTSPSGKNQYALGQKIDLHANANTNYRFVGWRQGTASVSDQPSFNYTIPAAHTQLTALFEYQPNNPSEPSPVPLQHKLLLNAFPAEGGHFNVGSGTIFKEGEIIHLQAYLNSGYEFEGWKQGEDIVSTEGSYSLTMGTEDISLTGMFRFNPSNPINPGANHWDAVTGEVIVDNFAMGNLMGAIDQVIGGSGNRDKVLKITVAGQMNAGDLGVSRYCSSCAIFDLKRISGISSLPAYTFDGSKLQSISLPGDITSIGNYAFRNCANLSEINCYSMIPPTLERDVFQGIGEAIVLRVPQATIPQYSAAAQWNQLAILPLTEDIGSLSVNLPEAASDGRYKNMTLELINTKSAQKLRFVITDKLKYVFGGLINGEVYNLYLKNTNEVILGEVKELKVTKEGTDTFFNSIVPLYNLSLTVSTNEGVDVSDNVIVKWYNADNKYISQGNELKNLIAGTKINYLIELNSSLGSSYVFPNIKEYVVSEHGNALTYSLQPIDLLDIKGVVKSKDGMLISGGVVSVSQLLNGKYSKSVITKTDKDGKYLLRVYNDVSNITISANGYINQNISRQNFNEGTDLGTTELGIISGATITTNFTYTPSVPIGETPEKQNEYANYQNVSYTLYNKTKARNITDFSVQYPSIVLLEPTNIGDEIQITATSRTYEFEPVVCNVVIDVSNRATAQLDIVQLGLIKALYSDSKNKVNVAMLYNSAGQRLKSFNYKNQSVTFSGLTNGTYTLVSMTYNRLFNSILNLSELTAIGLIENTDYVKSLVSISSGKIENVIVNEIPTIDLSNFSYTSSDSYIRANKSTIIAGNYLTLSSHIGFKESHSNQVSNVKLVIELPASCTFVQNSVMIGNEVVSEYAIDGMRISIPLSDYNKQVRFCIIPTMGGTIAPNGFVEFDYNGETLKQPFGVANCIVKDLSIIVPGTVAKTKFPVSGVALAHSTVHVYDNDVLIGQTTTLANGAWVLLSELYNAYNLSSHTIYALIDTPQGTSIKTESKVISYNRSAIEVQKVTMINTAHPSSSLDLCEYIVEFDFQNPKAELPAYWYWPNYPDFTFKIDFTNNSPEYVSDVTLYVTTSAGSKVSVPASYDKEKDIWFATRKFYTNALPANLSVDYKAETKAEIDQKHLMEVKAEYEETSNLFRKQIQVVDSVFSLDYKPMEQDSVLLSLGLFTNEEQIFDEDAYNKYLDGLTDEELDAIIKENPAGDSNTIDSLKYEMQILEKMYSSDEHFEFNTPEGVTLVSKSCDGLSDALLIERGYSKYQSTDGSSIYLLTTEQQTNYVNFSQDLFISITFPLAEPMRSQPYSVSAEDGVKIFNEWISKIRGAYEPIVTAYSDLEEKIGKLVDLLTTDFTIADNFYSLKNEAYLSKHNELARVVTKLEGMDPSDMMYGLTKLKMEVCQQEVKTATKILNAAKRNRMLTSLCLKSSKTLGPMLASNCPLLEYADKVATGVSVIYRFTSLYQSIPSSCEDDAEKAKACKGLAIAGGTYAGGLFVTKLGVEALMDIATAGQVIAAPATGGTSLGTAFATVLAKMVVNIAVDAAFSWEVDRRVSQIEQIRDDLTCKKEDKDDEDGDGSDGDGSGGDGSGGDGSGGDGSGGDGSGSDGSDDSSSGGIGNGSDGPGSGAGNSSNSGKTGNGGGKSGQSGSGNSKHLLDPSGYVYEAVPSNRLQGVTTTVYQKSYEEDMYGDKHEKIELWNAEEYAQENPLTTDENGMYAWDVPAGLWQVKYEKNGYQTAYSQWLPVPPPQLDVNVGMLQNTQPYVSTTHGYEGGIEIEFNKFMQPSTMTLEQIKVTRNGVAENGEVRMLNEESDPLKGNEKFVSKVRFVPEQSFATTDKVLLAVSRRVKSYVGINMESDFSQEISIEKEVKSIVTTPNIKVVYNQTAEIKIAVEPKEASVNKKITAFSASSSIASITPEAVLNEEGEATFTVTGELLGSTVLQFAVEGMDLKAEVKVNVVAAGLEDVSRSYQLSMGWNWLSVNVNDKNLNDVAALLEPIKESVVTIKGQNGELTNEESNGLQGSLTIWHPEQAYKIQMKQDATLDLKGKPILAAKSTITLNKGWNWMGYLPTEELSLESALPNLTAEKEDVIKGLDCFAIYTGTAWVGSLTHLTPGEGYMYYSQSVKSFNYAESEAEANAPYPPSQWEYNARQYADNMTLIARLYDREQPVQIDKYLIGAFVGNECRGVAVEKDGYIFLTIHGEQADEQVSLRAFDLTAEKEYTIKEEFHFSETMQGSYASPITLHLGELTGINSITKGLFIYPNPVRDRLYIRGNIDRLEAIYIVNSIGQTCILTDKLSVKEGIDVSSLPKGTYFMTIKSGKEILQQKFIKIE